MNPFAALKEAGLEWKVLESESVVGVFDVDGEKQRVATDEAKVLIRSDDSTILGVVGSDYTPIQNSTLAELAFALRKQSDGTAEVESAGSIRGGRRVWMLLRGESVSYGHKDDEVATYLFIANGHDGSLSLSVSPTNTRVVCSNTFHAALAKGNRRGSILRFRHTTGINERVDTLKECIANWRNTIDAGRDVALVLAKAKVNREKIQSLWTQVIEVLDGEIPEKPKNGWEEMARARAVEGLAYMSQVFDRESKQFGANVWVAANAATNWIQHVRSAYNVRTKDSAVRTYSAWDGTTASHIAAAYEIAKEYAK
jgi:phage/plasmid-like protein (TIGR03299 family)